MAGYSNTPLAKKFGIKEGCRVMLIQAPAGYRKLLEPLPAAERSELARLLPEFRGKLSPDAATWVSWPKKASKVATDITDDTIRTVALRSGFVDIKVCAVTEVWSGLKLVVRKALRGKS